MVWLNILHATAVPFSIDSYGAIANTDTPAAWSTNAAAFQSALSALKESTGSRTLLVPANNTYYTHPLQVSNLTMFTLQVDGRLIASNNITAWPTYPDHQRPKGADSPFQSILTMFNCSYFTITGHGSLDGQGYTWWWAAILNELKIGRPPLMVWIDRSHDFTVEKVYITNSPRFHFFLTDVRFVTFRDMQIYVDVEGQKKMLSSHGLLTSDGLPTFPLNTDGIDPMGSDILIENVTITNFDDAIAVKPNNAEDGVLSQCSANILVRNSHVKFSLGLSIGSVPPHPGVACIRNVTFQNVLMDTPVKGIYIKTDPGTKGTGIVQNIMYENITITKPLWWGIYIGPQQQKEPDGGGPGCMFYPWDPTCDTQALITIQDITLRNIVSTQGLFPPGILRCNRTNPCSNIVFQNVSVSGPMSSTGYICENVEVQITNDTFPKPHCTVT